MKNRLIPSLFTWTAADEVTIPNSVQVNQEGIAGIVKRVILVFDTAREDKNNQSSLLTWCCGL